jgi:3-methyladenine DNA glycosylase AlkD
VHHYLEELETEFKKHYHGQNAIAIKAYLRNQFEAYGITTPTRRKLCKEHMIKSLPDYKNVRDIVKFCWKKPERDWQYFAVELLAKFKKEWDERIVILMEWMIVHKSWWDTVDHIASELTGPYFLAFPKKIISITNSWNRSDNIWLQRSSLMFQKKYRSKTNKELLTKYILHLKSSKEFFVQKAIGWALREYSKTNPAWVKQFVAAHDLPSLSQREALKRLGK